jgi:hypothetical protein
MWIRRLLVSLVDGEWHPPASLLSRAGRRRSRIVDAGRRLVSSGIAADVWRHEPFGSDLAVPPLAWHRCQPAPPPGWCGEGRADAERRSRLERDAVDARALADLLERRAAELEKADEARALWYAHTAETRAAEQRAHRTRRSQHRPDQLEQPTTAEQWLDAYAADQAAEDQHRQITDETELADVVEQRDADVRAVEGRLPVRGSNREGHPRSTKADDNAPRWPACYSLLPVVVANV